MGLREEIHSRADCAVALAARDCEGIARILSTGRTRPAAIQKAGFSIWCAGTGLRAAIEDHALLVGSPLRSIALALRDFLAGPPTAVIDFSDPGNAQSLAAWKLAGAITQAQVDQITGMGVQDDEITAQDVAEAVYNEDGSLK